MPVTLIYFLIALFAFSIGFIIKNLMNKNQKLQWQSQSELEQSKLTSEIVNLNQQLQKHEKELLDKSEMITEINQQKESLLIQLTKKENDFENLLERHKEQKSELLDVQEKFNKEFENLANKILEEKTLKFTEQNKENLKNILSPLQEKILHFEKKVEDTHKESIGHHAALRQQILGLKEMNEQMTNRS
jgi:DNA recombination protein RmuC